MRAGFIGGLLLAVGALLSGCGGTDMEPPEELALGDTEQAALQACGRYLPPCPTGYDCIGDGIRGACEPSNPPPCGPALPACPDGFYCYAYPRGYCRPSP